MITPFCTTVLSMFAIFAYRKRFQIFRNIFVTNIDCFLSNNSGDPVVALLNNFALLSIDEVRSFTLLKFQTNYLEKITQKIHIFSIELQTCQGITNQYNNCYMSASFQLLLGSCMHNFLPQCLLSYYKI